MDGPPLLSRQGKDKLYLRVSILYELSPMSVPLGLTRVISQFHPKYTWITGATPAGTLATGVNLSTSNVKQAMVWYDRNLAYYALWTSPTAYTAAGGEDSATPQQQAAHKVDTFTLAYIRGDSPLGTLAFEI